MHGVEVTGRAGVADEHLPGERPELTGGCLHTHPQFGGRQLCPTPFAGAHRLAFSIKVALASATSAPPASRYSVTTVAKRIVPPRLPGLEYRSTTLSCAVRTSPATGRLPWKMYSCSPCNRRLRSNPTSTRTPVGAQRPAVVRNVGGMIAAGPR